MEIILISENKVKISMSREDLDSFALTSDIIDYSNAETKKMLWDILCQAKRTVGFDPDGYRIFVQLFPSKDGSCELFVTKISRSSTSVCDIFSSEIEKKDSAEECALCERTAESTEENITVFEMFSMEALSEACRRLQSTRQGYKSAVYMYNGKFYLVIVQSTPSFPCLIDELYIIGEYGDMRSSLLFELCECGTLICDDNAISIFSRL